MGKAIGLVCFMTKTDKSSTHVRCCLVGKHNNGILSGAVVHSCRPLLLNSSNLVSMRGAVAGWLKAGRAGNAGIAGISSRVEMGLGGWAFNQGLFSGADGCSLAGDGIVTNGSAGGGARDPMSGSGCLSLICVGTDSFDSGFLMSGVGKGGLKSSRMFLGLAGVTTGM